MVYEVNKKYKTSIGEWRKVIHICENRDVIAVDGKDIIHKYNECGEAITGNGIHMKNSPWLTHEEYNIPLSNNTISLWISPTPNLATKDTGYSLFELLIGTECVWSSKPRQGYNEYTITVERKI